MGTKYPSYNELGGWIETLMPVQVAVYDKLRDSNMSDWPPWFFDLVGDIVKDWNTGISSEVFHEAIACAVHHVVQGRTVPQSMKDFMDNREERVSL